MSDTVASQALAKASHLEGGEKTRILIVEDNSTQAKLLSIRLGRQGFDVECASTLAAACRRVSEPGISIILLDLSLPDSSGIETFRKLQLSADRVPIVVLTGLDDENIALEALQGGAQDYLIKGRPSDDSLGRCLRYAVERNRVELALRDNELRTRQIIENSLDAFISIDEQGLIVDWNLQAQKTFGWKHSEVLGKNILEIIVPARFGSHHALAPEQLKSKSNILNKRSEVYALHRDGHEFPIEMGVFKIRDGDSTFYCAFVNDITERKHMNEELEKRVQERTVDLMRSNEELHQFAKVASHDLQEPLRAIQGFANLLAKRYRGKVDETHDEFVDFILDGTNRMQQLIQAVLAHSSISNVAEKTECVTDCNSVLEEVLANLKTSITESGAKFIIGDLPEVAVERTVLIQLFQNLIGNAIKYRGDRSPEIYIASEKTVDKWHFSVRDNGIGIDPQYSSKIFDMFARLHGQTEYSGTGMGLAICKKIVEAHGGAIWVESKLGEGSIFYFTLPETAQTKEKNNGKTG
jgi:PAS domain S-box-containing protein